MLNKTEAELANAGARFLPMDPNDEGTLPCIEIAGVQVYVYIDDDGVLRISAHFDTAEEGILTPDSTVPTRVTMSGETVWEAE